MSSSTAVLSSQWTAGPGATLCTYSGKGLETGTEQMCDRVSSEENKQKTTLTWVQVPS